MSVEYKGEAKMAEKKQAKSSASLDSHIISGVRFTGVELGRGAFATVVKLNYRGLVCAGKKLHGLYSEETNREETERLLQRFRDECTLLAELKHPNIVQFLGLYIKEGSRAAVLVMEYLHTTLAKCIDRYKSLPGSISYSILKDVATALCYLHGNNPRIIHRDLSANNVLLTTSMQAKLSDLGVAKILDMTPAKKCHMTTCPGTLAYMPPDVLSHDSDYGTDIDCFSYGVLVIHIFCGEWPIPDPQLRKEKETGRLIPLNEVERREKYLEKLERDHPQMRSLVIQCLSDDDRPSAEDILQLVEEEMSSFPPHTESMLTMIKENESLSTKLQEAEESVNKLTTECSVQMDILKTKLDAEEKVTEERDILQSQMVEEREKYRQRSKSLTSEKNDLEARLEKVESSKSLEVYEYQYEIQRLSSEREIFEKRAKVSEEKSKVQSEAMDVMMNSLKSRKLRLLHVDEELETKEKQLKVKEEEIDVLKKTIEASDVELAAKKEELLAKDKEHENMQKAFDSIADQLNAMHTQIDALQSKLDASENGLEVKQKELDLAEEEKKIASMKETELKNELTNSAQVIAAKDRVIDCLRYSEIPSLESEIKLKEGAITLLKDQQKHLLAYFKGKDTPLSCPLKFQFKKCADLPIAMSDPQCAVVNDRVYVGGGLTDDKTSFIGQGQVFEYNQALNEWSTLPDCLTRRFGLVQLLGKLLTVGGILKSGALSASVYVYNKDTKSWEEDKVPPMPTKRFHPGVASYQSFLIVCGGIVQGGSLTNSVEILKDGVWHKASQLLHRCAFAKPIIAGELCYLMGGTCFSSLQREHTPTKVVLSIPLSTLLACESDKCAWEYYSSELCKTRLYKYAPTHCGGLLLMIGGWDQNDSTPKSDIVVYSSKSGDWVKIDSLPSPLSSSVATCQLRNGSMMIAGGNKEGSKISATTYLMWLQV